MIEFLPLTVSIEKLQKYYNSVLKHESGKQISLKYRKGFQAYEDGVGSALDPSGRKLLFQEKDFTELVENQNNPIFDIIKSVEDIAYSNFKLSIGRIRFMTLTSRTCLSYHRDLESIRFHIPITTNSNCFFIVDDQVFKMHEVGRLYTMRVDKMHTAVNADKEASRVHLVFSTY
jgi:hypothetical protein